MAKVCVWPVKLPGTSERPQIALGQEGEGLADPEQRSIVRYPAEGTASKAMRTACSGYLKQKQEVFQIIRADLLWVKATFILLLLIENDLFQLCVKSFQCKSVEATHGRAMLSFGIIPFEIAQRRAVKDS